MQNSHINSFKVSYDGRADVLYIVRRHEPAARGSEDDFGIVWRYDQNGRIISATVMDLKDRWLYDPAALARRLSQRFRITGSEARTVLDVALKEPSAVAH